MRERVRSIQGLRALAAMLVLFCHAPHNLWFFRLGYSGVDLFFVVSGFIMVVSTGNHTGPRAFKLFLINRFARIWPVYAATSVAMAIAFCIIGTVAPQDVAARLMNDLTFQPAWNNPPINAPGWSLTFEVFFYALFAFSLLFGRWRYPLLLGTMGTFLLLGGQSARTDGLWGYVALATNPVCGCFIAGVLAGLVYRSKWRGPPRPLAACLLAAFAVLTGYLLFFSIREFNHGLVWAAAFGGIVMSVALMEKRAPVWVPNSLVSVGNASFSLYISQWLVVVPFAVYAPPVEGTLQILMLACAFLLTIAAISAVTYRLLETDLSLWTRTRLHRFFQSADREPAEIAASSVPAQ
ncbi:MULTISPECIES: acyltransferase [unclassified Mesorhizobium]|uniref:acyltransferase family protein n=1 Tax=unclassified Mesorhizobium TaxID=325217 RepID=UPI0003CEF5B8|nr:MULTISPECIES: acyltransferase [unclassified Mesorhizobium]ESX59681.1 exopolysaccharide biosynthesis protein [Mesorhizobium sp. LSHC422A00]ESY16548.1 exopolysaccharide biosynthesis protein [Mesorhizobium sp. LNJC395A00]ESY45614.1 exopolysaccharide biosynthesis protein [Mesorhizobium sp. LNJC380A00]